MDPTTVVLALVVTLFAGLSTGIGGLISMFQKRSSSHFLSVSLGFSAGVMVYLSFMEILPEGLLYLQAYYPAPKAAIINIASFFMGIAVIALIDRFVPSRGNPHEIPDLQKLTEGGCVGTDHCLLRTGMLSAIAIAIHNFPEGLATFTSYMADAKIGLGIAIAIAIHNIPEGIAVSVPVYYATGSKRKAFMYSFLSGLSEPVGALIAYLILMPYLNDVMFGVIFAAVAGIMVFISLDELLPSAREYGEPHLSIYGMVSGMAVMAVSLLLFL